MKKSHIFILHVIFWIVFAFIPIIPVFFYKEPIPAFRIVNLITVNLCDILNFYTFYFLLIPIFIKLRKILVSVAGSLIFVILFTVLRVYALQIAHHITGVIPPNEKYFIEFHNIPVLAELASYSILFTGFSFLIYLVIDRFSAQKQKSELMVQNKASELLLLRSQLNPHFLFNTLNNIYSLVNKKDDSAPDAITRLSDILRYVLYEANSDRVNLAKEIEYLKSYIELQKLRTAEKDFVEFTVKGDVSSAEIAPMLLIPFIENAFKHGTKKNMSPGIKIEIVVDDFISFRISNHINPNQSVNKDKIGGVGLNNVVRRLDLLYPGRHLIEIYQHEDLFRVELSLKPQP
jgi:two-component system, LytTR family, sensor kinase